MGTLSSRVTTWFRMWGAEALLTFLYAEGGWLTELPAPPCVVQLQEVWKPSLAVRYVMDVTNCTAVVSDAPRVLKGR